MYRNSWKDMLSSGYTPGSLSKLLGASSDASSSKESKLQAIFATPASQPAARQKPVFGKNRNRQKDAQTASPSVSQHETSRRAKKRKLEDAAVVYKREAGLREAETESSPRKKKRKEKRSRTADVAESPSSRDTSQLKTFEDFAARRVSLKRDPEKEARTVFVGNVALTVDKKVLKHLFGNCGKVESIRLRSVPVADMKLPKRASIITKNFHPSRQSANAYVVFASAESVPKALTLSGTELQGLHIRVDKSKCTKKHDHKHSIFVGNLAFDVEEEAVRQHFEDCGDVTAVRVIRDRITGAGKGFGYVSFSDASSVTLALSLNSQPLGGRPLRIERSTQKQKPATKPGSGAGGNRASKKTDALKKRTDSFANKKRKNSAWTDDKSAKSSPAKKLNPAETRPPADTNKKRVDHKKQKELKKKKLRKKALKKKKDSLGQLLTKKN